MPQHCSWHLDETHIHTRQAIHTHIQDRQCNWSWQQAPAGWLSAGRLTELSDVSTTPPPATPSLVIRHDIDVGVISLVFVNVWIRWLGVGSGLLRGRSDSIHGLCFCDFVHLPEGDF